MSVTVAEEGNRRKSGPNSSEVRQSLLDIKSWFVVRAVRASVCAVWCDCMVT